MIVVMVEGEEEDIMIVEMVVVADTKMIIGKHVSETKCTVDSI